MARGVRDFKHFLEFADRGARALAEAFAPTGGDVESPFEAAVMAGLEARGWTVHTQIGVSGFRVDLGIVHPDAPARYLAGVECGGSTYHSSATARDRDRLREHVLTDLGWRIRRVWSTEWWMDAEGALAKLDQRLIEDLEADRARAAAAVPVEPAVDFVADEQGGDEPTAEPEIAPPIADTPSEPANDPEPVDEAIPARLYADQATPITTPAPRLQSHDEVRDYRIADLNDLSRPVEPGRFYDASYRPALSAMVDHVLSVEGPIYEELLIRRIARAHGLQRVGPLVREAIAAQIDASVARTDDEGCPVLWPPGEEPRTSYPYRPADASVRSHSETPMPELVGIALSLQSNNSEAERTPADRPASRALTHRSFSVISVREGERTRPPVSGATRRGCASGSSRLWSF